MFGIVNYLLEEERCYQMNGMNRLDTPQLTLNTELWFTQECIKDSVTTLMRVLLAINKWAEIARTEFEESKKDLEKKYPNGFDHGCVPIADEGIMLAYTEDALYGSFAVNIAALVEDHLALLFQRVTILNDNSNDKETKKPHFGDYMYTLEKKYGFTRQDIEHHGDHLFVRELANCFKHSGGNSTKRFVDEFGTRAGIERKDEHIQYNRYCWENYIQQSRELLIDVAKRFQTTTAGKAIDGSTE